MKATKEREEKLIISAWYELVRLYRIQYKKHKNYFSSSFKNVV